MQRERIKRKQPPVPILFGKTFLLFESIFQSPFMSRTLLKLHRVLYLRLFV